MDFLLNLIIILLAISAFLLIYYYTLNKDRKLRENRLPLNNIDYETGEELGVDGSIMENIKQGTSEELGCNIEGGDLKRKVNINEKYQLNEKYGLNFIRLFSRDPEHLFSYWEINNNEFYENQPALKLYCREDNNEEIININHLASNWYLGCKPGKNYQLKIGYFKNGVFHQLSCSNFVQTPLGRPSDIIDEHWMTIEKLSMYSYRIEMDTLSMVKNIEKRKISEELEADSLAIVKR